MVDTPYTPVALRLTVDLDRHPDMRQPLEKVLGVPLATPNRTSGTDPFILWEGPHDWLILCSNTNAEALQDTLMKVAVNKPALVTFAGDGLAAFAFADPDAATRLSSGTSLDLSSEIFPVGASAVTRFAQVRGALYRLTDRYCLIVDRQFSHHIELWLARLTKE
jgi:heterotetrameric sarcosine oxidase gamma subunit